jgi:uncharacterized damage-inducible protein DinB
VTLAPIPLALDAGATGRAQQLMFSLMRYKRWADAELMKTVVELPALAGTREEGIVTAVVRHFHTVDCIFKAHLLGVPHEYTSANPAEPATLAELRPRVAAVDEWYVAYTRDLDERDQGEVLNVTFTDGKALALTRLDILLHVTLHGAYHRGNIGVLLKLSGAEPAPDGIPAYVRQLAAAS